MIRVYTKPRHVQKISKFLDEQNIPYRIFTKDDDDSDAGEFDLGVSYCYPRKIIEPLLSSPKRGFINYHPGPLPKYKGPTEIKDAIKNKETHWGVTVHFMDENYDTGPIIKVKNIELHEPPSVEQELGAVSHYFLFRLFKETLVDIYNEKLT